MALQQAAEKIAAEFDYSADDVRRGVHEFLRQMKQGLADEAGGMNMIPTYVTAVPDGSEKGLYLAVDLGGTNFRVCSITLHGNSTFSIESTKVAIPKEMMVAPTSSKQLFGFLAQQVDIFLRKHHKDMFEDIVRRNSAVTEAVPSDESQRTQSTLSTKHRSVFELGFTFSFPTAQYGINKGHLMRWTKGFDLPDAIDQDVCALLQEAIDSLNLPVKVAALVNDTVGTLMARAYTAPGKTPTLIGAIFGTGTNGAYVERLSHIPKMNSSSSSSSRFGDSYDRSTGEMVVNTEWGGFDNSLRVLPNTPYDVALDQCSVNPGMQMFEKRVSGMFLGEILRHAMLALVRDAGLFADRSSSDNDTGTTTNIEDDSALYRPWSIDTSFLSYVEQDNDGSTGQEGRASSSSGLHLTRQLLERELGVDGASTEDARAVRTLVHAIGRRSARLSALAIGACIINSGRLTNRTQDLQQARQDRPPARGRDEPQQREREPEIDVDVGVDGSVVEYYPGFDGHLREALREMDEIGPEGERRIRIGIAKDGSGVGAALIALVAGRQNGQKRQAD